MARASGRQICWCLSDCVGTAAEQNFSSWQRRSFCRTLDSSHIRTHPKRSGVIEWCWSWDRYQTLNACGWRRSTRTFYPQLSIPNPSVFFHMLYEVRKSYFWLPRPELQRWSWWNPRVQVAISLLACTSGCQTSKYNDPLLTTITWQVSPFKPCIRPLYQTNDKNASSRHVIHKRFLYTLCLEVANSWFSTEGTSQDASGFSRVYQVIASRTQFWECAC